MEHGWPLPVREPLPPYPAWDAEYSRKALSMPHIHDIEGTFCPMGCGQTLHLMAGNMISCLAPECPDKGAAQKILSDPESEHVVVFGPDSFTVRHPLRERLGDLIACDMHTACTLLPGPPEGRTGQYRATFTATGLDLEPLDAEPGQPAQKA